MGSAADSEPASPTRRLRSQVAETLGKYPYAFVAVKSAIAAGLAWALVQPLWGPADDYPYYAPLGAVVAMSTTAVSSVRTSVHAVLAICLGAAVAVVGAQLPGPGLVALMLVVGAATGLSFWRRLGAMGTWVPFAALFVLIFGGRDPWHYVLGYAGLTAFGALVGILVNLAAPQLPLARTLNAVKALRTELGKQLRELADDVANDGDLLDQSNQVTSSVRPHARQLEQLVSEVREARQVNWRAGRWRNTVDEREQQARAQERMAYLVDEVAALLSRSDRHVLAGGSALGDAVAEALRATAAMVEAGPDAYTEDDEGDSPYEETRRRVRHLRAMVRQSSQSSEETDDLLVAASVTVSLERALDVWA